MPTYEHICRAEGCGHEWEDYYGMTVDPPTLCPGCNEEGHVERLVSGGSGPGIMRRTGNELRANVQAETRAMKERIKTDENFRANLVGEDKYHQRVLKTEALEKQLVNIGKGASSIKSTDVKPSTSRPKIKTSKTSKT